LAEPKQVDLWSNSVLPLASGLKKILSSNKLEKLDDLPVNEEAKPNPQEQQVMDKYFSEGDGKVSGKTQDSLKWGMTFKLAGLASLLFMALANPFVDGVFNILPYCGGNAFATFGVKIFIFMMLFVMCAKFLI
jgi:hypothetical protein